MTLGYLWLHLGTRQWVIVENLTYIEVFHQSVFFLKVKFFTSQYYRSCSGGAMQISAFVLSHFCRKSSEILC